MLSRRARARRLRPCEPSPPTCKICRINLAERGKLLIAERGKLFFFCVCGCRSVCALEEEPGKQKSLGHARGDSGAQASLLGERHPETRNLGQTHDARLVARPNARLGVSSRLTFCDSPLSFLYFFSQLRRELQASGEARPSLLNRRQSVLSK